jgi:hypothetical protein
VSHQLLDEEFLTERETGILLGLTVETLRIQACRRKGPPRVKIGRTIYYRKTSLLRWILQHKTFPESARKAIAISFNHDQPVRI